MRVCVCGGSLKAGVFGGAASPQGPPSNAERLRLYCDTCGHDYPWEPERDWDEPCTHGLTAETLRGMIA